MFGEQTHQVLWFCSVCCNIIHEGTICSMDGCKRQGVKHVEFYCGDLTPQLKKHMEGS